ncbi:MAG: PAS domain S-box protein, partial [Desulfuromusa sp.]|nr:PAS domain S-box protein [Desulfuromusa sp.]
MNNQLSLEELTKQVATLQEENRQITQSLQTLKEDSAQCKDLIESAPDAIFVGSPDGNIIYANRSASTLTRYSKFELLSMNLGQLFTEEERQRSPLQYEQLNQGKTVKNERLLNRKDGTVIPIEMNSKVSPDGTYQSFFRDISNRKEADNALRTSEEKFSRAFKLSPDVIAITRLTDGLYLEVNQGFTNALGWTAEEAVGRTTAPGDLDIWANNEDREKLMAGIKESGQVVGLEARFKHRNGQILIGLMSAKIIEINGNSCLLSVTRDITERSRTMEKQKKLELQMLQVQKLESLGVLAGGIAHDFNNILMAVIGHSELAQRRLPTESPAMENLHQINLAASRAADLANQMLAYSGKGKFVVEA